MARIPNADRAVLDLAKIQNYCLSAAHPRGRHKARVFREALDIGPRDAEWLRQVLLNRLPQQEAVELAEDRYGTRWRVDISVTRQNRQAVVRTMWIMRTGEQIPRFVTCWIL